MFTKIAVELFNLVLFVSRVLNKYLIKSTCFITEGATEGQMIYDIIYNIGPESSLEVLEAENSTKLNFIFSTLSSKTL